MSGRGLQLTEDGPKGTFSDTEGYRIQIVLPSTHTKSLVHRRFIAIHLSSIHNHPLTLHSPSIPLHYSPPSTASLPVRSRQLVTAPLQRRPELLTSDPPDASRRTEHRKIVNLTHFMHVLFFSVMANWRNGAMAGFLIFLAVFGS